MRHVLPLLALLVIAPAAGAQVPLSRPASDQARDAARKPDEMMRFAHVGSGARVVDFIPGGGYFTRVFAAAVGPTGQVYADVPKTLSDRAPEALTSIEALAASPGYGRVAVVSSFTQIPRASVDVVWTAQNYHDLQGNLPAADLQLVNAAIFAALKPGGYYVVVDHMARPGSGDTDSKTLHRIDPSLVEAEVVAAGFIVDGRSEALRNPADMHDKKVFDPSIRGHTDQFAIRFRKPL